MSFQATIVTIPNMQLTLDQLLAVIRQLDESTRVQVAQVLVETSMDEKLANLIKQLANTAPADDISDAEIESEIRSVRQFQRENALNVVVDIWSWKFCQGLDGRFSI